MRLQIRHGAVLALAAALLALPALADDHGSGGGGGSEAEVMGVVSALPAAPFVGDWTVAGRTVHVTATTAIDTGDGQPAVGAIVEVKGANASDGGIDAASIEVKSGAPESEPTETKLVGAIEALPAAPFVGDWTVGGKTVHVTATTKLETEGGTFAVGATVQVEGTLKDDGTIDATDISLEGDGGAAGHDTELRGQITALPSSGLVGDWTVGGKTVHVTATTRIEAEHFAAVLGAIVEVHGTVRDDGSIDATNIEVVESPQLGPHGSGAASAKFEGTVEALAGTPGFVGDWTVAGVTVHVTDATRIEQEDATLDVGALVEVKGTRRDDGSVDARRIEVLTASASSTPTSANTFFVPAVAHAAGKNGASYTTDLVLTNTGAVNASLDLLFLGHERDGRSGQSAALTVAAGASTTVHDVLGSLFGIQNGFGAIRITSNVPTLVVEASTSTPGGGGTFGQGHAALDRNELGTTGRARSITGVTASAAFRTNLMIVNATEKPLDVIATLISDRGLPLGTAQLHLQALEMRQMDDAAHALGATGDVASARIRLETSTPGGAFAAQATLIDNRTNDPRVLTAR